MLTLFASCRVGWRSRRDVAAPRPCGPSDGDGADRRDDLLHKASAAVARSAEVVVTETLYLAGLLRNHRIARSLSEAALGRLVAMVRYKAKKLGGIALGAPRFFPSSKRCACCGAVNDSVER